MKKNKNDTPLQTPDTSFKWEDYKNHHQFSKIGEITFGPNTKGNEKIFFNPIEKDRRALVYAIVVGGYLQKIGKTIATMKGRTQSYDCGKDKYRFTNGTCSTTNWFIRSTLKLWHDAGHTIEIFAYHMQPTLVEYDFGEFRKDFCDPKELEKTILKGLKEDGRFPVLCTQR